jgi:hypothetical protein
MIPGETVTSGAPGPAQNPNIRGPKVMRSAAGFYIGYGYFDPEWGFEEPYSRESGYFRTHEDAQKALDVGAYGR